VKVIPLVVNPGFNQPMFHHVLASAELRHVAARNITALCRDNGFDGIQFDFENIAVTDRDAFTAFSREVADSLHAARCSISAAVVPRSSENPGPSSYHQWMFANWRGVYDFKALADCMDFLSLMTYSQHTRRTPPGPVAGFPWMEDAVKYLLVQGVPPSKISLGLPAYSQHWFTVYDTVGGARTTGSGLGYDAAAALLARAGASPVWEARQQEWYAAWENDGLYEWVFMQDARAFDARLEMVRRYGLRGYSVWRIGQEDPKVWTLPRVVGQR
jgi:spore germination protein YaaH